MESTNINMYMYAYECLNSCHGIEEKKRKISTKTFRAKNQITRKKSK